MNRPRLIKVLKITFSAACGIACVLSVMLWARSHFVKDNLACKVASRQLLLRVHKGVIVATSRYEVVHRKREWLFVSDEPTTIDTNRFGNVGGVFYPQMLQTGKLFVVLIPLWFSTTVAAIFALLPWLRQMRFRFSVRTLLIATTAIAVVLGYIVWATR